eukprot:TRINITY_DN34858_c0_g1_i1.p2 TRINITY_DN34858_c0_g1~~TRINITY_DN34858_c0_g1_i1.p2  ORF type:complete len:439 (+),score=67.04 TRINITY_DN34858_c0_g1_i1:693-2009(+)
MMKSHRHCWPGWKMFFTMLWSRAKKMAMCSSRMSRQARRKTLLLAGFHRRSRLQSGSGKGGHTVSILARGVPPMTMWVTCHRRLSDILSAARAAMSGLAGSPPVEAVVRRPSFQQQLASHAGGDTWLPPSSAEPEEKRFRRLLADNLGEGDLSAASFFDFFRVVRDAVEECEEAAEAALFAAAGASTSASSSHRPRGSSTPRSGRGASGYRIASHAALRQGVARLFVVVRHRLREVYRELESIPPRPRQAGTPSRATSAPGGGDFVGHDSIFAGLICSQARTAAMLERRAQRVPWAYRLLWQLARIGRRRTLETLVHWRHLTFPASAGGAGSGEEDLGEEVSFQDVPLHSTEPQREPSAGPLRQSSAEAGSASSSPTRRWGGVGARSPTSPSASLEPEREPSAALTPASLPSSRPGSVRRASQDRGMGLGLTLQVDPP